MSVRSAYPKASVFHCDVGARVRFGVQRIAGNGRNLSGAPTDTIAKGIIAPAKMPIIKFAVNHVRNLQ
jgi:hypothetical protein